MMTTTTTTRCDYIRATLIVACLPLKRLYFKMKCRITSLPKTPFNQSKKQIESRFAIQIVDINLSHVISFGLVYMCVYVTWAIELHSVEYFIQSTYLSHPHSFAHISHCQLMRNLPIGPIESSIVTKWQNLSVCLCIINMMPNRKGNTLCDTETCYHNGIYTTYIC